MKINRGTRVFGTMMFVGVLVAVLVGHWRHAGAATLAAIVVGGFLGEAWHRARKSGLI